MQKNNFSNSAKLTPNHPYNRNMKFNKGTQKKLMTLPSEKILNETVTHFSKYREKAISCEDATEILLNFNSFAHLLIKLDKKRNAKKAERKLKDAS